MPIPTNLFASFFSLIETKMMKIVGVRIFAVVICFSVGIEKKTPNFALRIYLFIYARETK